MKVRFDFDDAAIAKLAQDFGKPADRILTCLIGRSLKVEKVE